MVQLKGEQARVGAGLLSILLVGGQMWSLAGLTLAVGEYLDARKIGKKDHPVAFAVPLIFSALLVLFFAAVLFLRIGPPWLTLFAYAQVVAHAVALLLVITSDVW
jgi:hypothetical protein